MSLKTESFPCGGGGGVTVGCEDDSTTSAKQEKMRTGELIYTGRDGLEDG